MDDGKPESEDETSADGEVPGQLITKEINKKGRLPIPEKLRSVICTDQEDGNSITFWGYEKSLNLAVLSREWPTNANNRLIGSYSSNGRSWVHIADEVAETTEIKQDAGKLVYFFSYGNMREEGEAYVLSERQAWKLLPVDELPDTEGIGERVIRDAPGFLSSVR